MFTKVGSLLTGIEINCTNLLGFLYYIISALRTFNLDTF